MNDPNKVTNEWRLYYYDIGLPASLCAAYIRYVEGLLRKNLPPIFEFNHLSLLLGRDLGYLASVVNAPECHYREFEIPKRSGGKRKICAPYPLLLDCQQWINSHILEKIPVHDAAHGFVCGRSIKSNAQMHVGSKRIVKIDIKDFFPSIDFSRIVYIFSNIGYPPNVSFYLASICCSDGSLPQGAATSPSLSNLVCRRLDARISAISKQKEIVYTRYADDLTFSGEDIPYDFIKFIYYIIHDEGFCINNKKTRFIETDKRGGIVTGVCVSNGRITVPSSFKRKLRHELHFIKKFGFLSHASKKKIRDPFYLDRLIGRVSFWNWIERSKESEDALGFLRSISV